MLKIRNAIFIGILFLSQSVLANTIDHGLWDQLLKAHVKSINHGKSTMVDYQGMANEHVKLNKYLNTLSAVTYAQFDILNKQEQLAFLINAYNAWTVKLVLSGPPDLKSIKDLGSFFSSPWKKEFVVLLEDTRSLDEIEHKLIRGSDRYNDPRIHFAVNCASISCPALRAEAYDGIHINEQLMEQTTLFLSNLERNRVEQNVIKLSSIFNWYREDFEKGWMGYHQLQDFLINNSVSLNLSEKQIKKLKTNDMDIEFLKYDWRLNNQY